ncbi:hypothetical protein AKO1_000969 [Acrasis kona]|uniref:Histidine kinase n=1 Tax=Acrasis kona TaxID=1008807 RepID=A0AAW2ZCR8_9EUKA
MGSRNIVNRVIDHKSTVVSGCAYKQDDLYNDSYVLNNSIKSLLCMPVIHQKQLIAILYLENNMATDCFKNHTVNLLNILCTQIAISLTNARSVLARVQVVKELAEAEASRDQEQQYRIKQEEFVDRICHEIRNPIQGLLGNCEIIYDSIDRIQQSNYDQEKTKEMLSVVMTSASSIQVCGKYQKVITDDVLTLSKLEFSRVKINEKPMMPIVLLTNVIQMFEGDVSAKNIFLNLNVPSKMRQLVVCADYNRISQVLINLVSNAIKFTTYGGVTITCEHKILEDQQIRLEFSVIDSGTGISQQDQALVFDRFVQGSHNNNGEYSGSGLGLCISKMLTELMGGGIWITSKLGEGSTFFFTIICSSSSDGVLLDNKQQQHDELTQEANQQEWVPSRKFKVLVVEDNLINQRVIVRMLDALGCTCDTASNGVEGLEKATSNSYDIIFMDVKMPKMNGYECTSRIRELEKNKGEGSATVIVGLSGNARQEYHEQGIESGMNSYLTKPVRKKDLEIVLKNLEI